MSAMLEGWELCCCGEDRVQKGRMEYIRCCICKTRRPVFSKELWAYKRYRIRGKQQEYFCSYGCMRKWEKEKRAMQEAKEAAKEAKRLEREKVYAEQNRVRAREKMRKLRGAKDGKMGQDETGGNP